MKKKFGQNFLKNQQIINEIINFSEIRKESSVYEIGPGMVLRLLEKYQIQQVPTPFQISRLTRIS